MVLAAPVSPIAFAGDGAGTRADIPGGMAGDIPGGMAGVRAAGSGVGMAGAGARVALTHIDRSQQLVQAGVDGQKL